MAIYTEHDHVGIFCKISAQSEGAYGGVEGAESETYP